MDYRKYAAELSRRLKEAFQVALEDHAIDGLSVRAIDPDAIAWFEEHWRDHDARVVRWDWSSSDHRPDKGFSVAIWYGDTLCGLASGVLSGHAVRLDFIERFPGENPLKGQTIPIALTVVDAYADLVGKEDIRIHDVAEGLIPIYARFEFELAPERGKVHVMQRKRT